MEEALPLLDTVFSFTSPVEGRDGGTVSEPLATIEEKYRDQQKRIVASKRSIHTHTHFCAVDEWTRVCAWKAVVFLFTHMNFAVIKTGTYLCRLANYNTQDGQGWGILCERKQHKHGDWWRYCASLVNNRHFWFTRESERAAVLHNKTITVVVYKYSTI